MSNTDRHAFVGIDVAIAKKKRLPIVLCTYQDGVLTPRPLKTCLAKPPKGRGNVAALSDDSVREYATEAVGYLWNLERELDVSIQRMAIDAPSAPRRAGLARRAAECAMDLAGISCIGTPSLVEFDAIRERASSHLANGGAQATLPHANQLWMLVGFELFRQLGEHYECIEVYPHAIVSSFDVAQIHKSKEEGLVEQLDPLAKEAGRVIDGVDALADIAYGARHDKLDAYLAAWVASQNDEQRIAFGEPPDDVIWIPSRTQ